MDIAAYLKPNLLAHLTLVTAGEHRIYAADSWTNLTFRIRTTPVDVAVLDPMADDEARTQDIIDILDEFPSVPIIIYTQLSATTLQATVALARAGVRSVVLYRFDDERRQFLELIESQPGAALAQLLLNRIDEQLQRTTASVRRAIERLFGQPAHFTTVPELAKAALMSRRTLYRKLDAAGLASPHDFIVAARLLRAYAYMREPGTTLESAGHKLGFELHAFRRQVRNVFGTTPQNIRKTLEPDSFIEIIAALLCPKSDRDPTS